MPNPVTYNQVSFNLAVLSVCKDCLYCNKLFAKIPVLAFSVSLRNFSDASFSFEVSVAKVMLYCACLFFLRYQTAYQRL